MSESETPPDSAAAAFGLLEVAVALPLRRTYTYRDPRPGQRPALGAQVIVPFQSRVVTGFVVGYPDKAPDKPVRDIEGVVDEDPVVDADVLHLCRWAAGYYMAPFGEVLRTALPQGERASSRRMVRLSEQGMRLLALERGGKSDLRAMILDPTDRILLKRLDKRGLLSLRALQKDGAVGAPRVDRLIKGGWLEVGDEVGDRQRQSKEKFAVVVPEGMGREQRALQRAPVQKALFAKLLGEPAGTFVSGLSDVEKTALRALIKRGFAVVEERDPKPLVDGPIETTLPTLNAEQQDAFDALHAGLSAGYAPFLLQGITGSGKTEVYLRVIAEARAQGKGALVLVPEISLTPQLASRFRARFGDDVAVLHSALPPGERLAAWRRLRRGEMGIALGARSAVFAPVRKLGIIVVDEEHDGSFKQDDGVRYNGRDLAIVRARRAGAVAVLGSATPSLESFRNAESGRYQRLCLTVRAAPGAADRPLPQTEIIDLRQRAMGPDGLFSPPLLQAIEETLAVGDQTILFLNRRGFSTVVLCRGCGQVHRCNDCAVSMTFHMAKNHVACHYCGKTAPVPKRCPKCNQSRLEKMGTGTERVETVVKELFPNARVARLDRDTADRVAPEDGFGGSGKGLEKILARMHARDIDILVGTQMVTKGHDFPHVTLVGVLQPDQGMHLPDFRAAERTFQILEQVAGRAGRAEKPGRVLVQTYNPQHPAMLSLITHDYDGFARQELMAREAARYPPYARLIALRLDGTDNAQVRIVGADVAARAQKAAGPEVRVLGPADAPIARIRGRHRMQVWLAGAQLKPLIRVATLAAGASLRGDVRLAVDVDPQSVL